MKWSNEYKIHYYYTDYNNILKPGYIGRYMQETAWNALKNGGPSPEYLRENNLAFILAKISFRYYEEIYEDDIIKVETWVNPAKTLVFPRNYRVLKDNKIAAEAVSAWVLMDIKEKNILKPDVIQNDFQRRFKEYDDEELDFNVQKRFKMPANIKLNGFGEYKVRCSDIDTYTHMNNVVYIDLVCDNLYDDSDIISSELKKRILSLDINYNNEARFAQTIEINKGFILSENIENSEEHYIKAKIKNAEQNCFEAKIVLVNK